IVLGILLILVVAGVRTFGSDNLRYMSQLNDLEQRRQAIKTKGVTFDGTVKGYASQEFLSVFDGASFREASENSKESTEIAIKLLNDRNIVTQLASVASIDNRIAMPAPNDFLLKQNSNASKRAAKSLKNFVEDAIMRASVEDALSGLELLNSMQKALTGNQSEETLIFWFGVNSDVLALVWRTSQINGITVNQKKRLRQIVSSDSAEFSLKTVAVRQCREMVSLTRNLDKVTDEDKAILDMATESTSFPEGASRKVIRDVIESELLQVWISVLDQYSISDDQEIVGAQMDQVALQSIGAVKDAEAGYMVLAFPYLLEQCGRMLMRVLQGRTAILMALDSDFKPGISQREVSGIKVELTTVDDGDQWIISSQDRDPREKYHVSDNLEINQRKGVRLFVKK
ncbi:MAG: hypothetical protein ACKVQS_09840, partial [Fimbriimonadaceae bacterium]